jgi:hypothetical protein
MAFSNHDTFQTRFLIRFCQHFALLFAVCYSSYRLQSEVFIRLRIIFKNILIFC